MKNILLLVFLLAVAGVACAPVQSTTVPVTGDSYSVANVLLTQKYGFEMDLPRDRWSTLACDFNVDFSGNITWRRLCWANDAQERAGVLAVVTKLCFRPDVIEKKILDWYAGKHPYTILKKEASEDRLGRAVTHYVIHHWDHTDYLSMVHVWTQRASLVILVATGKDKHGEEAGFRNDFESAIRGVVVPGAAVSRAP